MRLAPGRSRQQLYEVQPLALRKSGQQRFGGATTATTAALQRLQQRRRFGDAGGTGADFTQHTFKVTLGHRQV